MNFEHRSYNSSNFRPTPEILFEPEGHLFVVATPWGARSTAQRAIQTISDFIHQTREDAENTAPYPKLSCLTPNANNLRIAVLLANERIYREENANEFLTGVELFAALMFKKEFVWIQIGQPNLFLNRRGVGMLPLGSHLDLSVDMSKRGSLMSPLPGFLLGLDHMATFGVFTFTPRKGDQLILLSRSTVPKSIFNSSDSKVSLQAFGQTCAADNPNIPFWLGTFSF